jgi:DNA-binding transcriptional regulator PaaX
MSTKEEINLALKIIGKQGFSGKKIKAKNAVQAFNIIFQSHNLEINYQKLVSELRRQSLVDFSQKSNYQLLRITPAGAFRLQKLIIDELEIKTPSKWDNKWRIVIFDIPLNNSKNRSYFTLHLKKLGLRMIQKSVWVHPYSCYKEIYQLAGHYNLSRYCSFFEVDIIDNPTLKRLKQNFKL